MGLPQGLIKVNSSVMTRLIPKDKDNRPPGSKCGQKKEDGGRGRRGTSSFGTDARLFDFPQMITTEWQGCTP